MIGTSPMMRFYLSLYLFVAAVYLLSASGRLGLSDGFAMFNVARSMVNERSLSAEPCDPLLPGHPTHCVLGVDGRYYAGFGLVSSLLAAPSVFCAQRVAVLLHVSGLAISKVAVAIFTALVSPLACVVLAMWIVKLGYSSRIAMLGACILAFASPFWQFGVKGFYSEPFVTLSLALTAYLLSTPSSSRAAALAGLAFGVACGCRINAVILFPVFILYLAFCIHAHGSSMVRFLRETAYFTMTFSVCIFLIGLTNYTRFGSPFKTGYHLTYPTASLLFSTPFLHGGFELLFSGEIGLLIFAPWVLIALICFPSFARAHLPESVLCGTLFLFNFIFFSKYDSWHAGWVAGPRFLTPTLPFLVVAIAPYINGLLPRDTVEKGPRPWVGLRMVLLILLIASALVQCFGLLYPTERYYRLMAFYGDTRPKPWWAGSIPLASIDFIPRIVVKIAHSTGHFDTVDHDQLSVAHEQTEAWATMNKANTEEDFLQSFPNYENLILPNLMVFKMKLLGFPASALYGYIFCTVLVGVVGLTGLKRHIVPNRNKRSGLTVDRDSSLQ